MRYCDGIFGVKPRCGKAFQKAYGLAVDGKLNYARKIEELLKRQEQQPDVKVLQDKNKTAESELQQVKAKL